MSEPRCPDWDICRTERLRGLCISLVWAFVLLGVGVAGTMVRGASSWGLSVVGVFFGACGGWAKSVVEIWTFMYKATNPEDPEESGLKPKKPNPWNNFVLKPLVWPFSGALFGLALTSVFYDAGDLPLKAVLTGLIGGAYWDLVLRGLGGLPGMGPKSTRKGKT